MKHHKNHTLYNKLFRYKFVTLPLTQASYSLFQNGFVHSSLLIEHQQSNLFHPLIHRLKLSAHHYLPVNFLFYQVGCSDY